MSLDMDRTFLDRLSLPDRDTRWMDDGLCHGLDPSTGERFDPGWWFPEPIPNMTRNGHRATRAELRERWEKVTEIRANAAKAKAICQDCPVRGQCFDDAFDRGERWGIWGGMDFHIPRDHRRKAS